MPGLTGKKIRNMTPTERAKKLAELQSELTKIRALTLSGTPGKTSKIKEIRRTIARIHTINREQIIATNSSLTNKKTVNTDA